MTIEFLKKTAAPPSAKNTHSVAEFHYRAATENAHARGQSNGFHYTEKQQT